MCIATTVAPASGRLSLSGKQPHKELPYLCLLSEYIQLPQPRKELPYLCLLNELIQLPYLCLFNEKDFWASVVRPSLGRAMVVPS